MSLPKPERRLAERGVHSLNFTVGGMIPLVAIDSRGERVAATVIRPDASASEMDEAAAPLWRVLDSLDPVSRPQRPAVRLLRLVEGGALCLAALPNLL